MNKDAGHIKDNPIHFNRIWTYEKCRQVALQYNTIKDLKKGCPGAYYAARKYGWLEDFSWIQDGRLTGLTAKSRWDFDSCYREAKKYQTKADFIHGSASAYAKALQKGWLNEYTWFIDGVKRMAEQNTIWTYESCYQLAQQCKTPTDIIKKSKSAYNVILRNGWMKDYTWISHVQHSWTYEECREVAKKYKTRSEFYKSDAGAYSKSLKEGWLDEFDWFERPCNIYIDNRDSVYAYFFEPQHAVYVGRTVNPQSRDLQHRTSEKSAVFRFANQVGVPVPAMTTLQKGLTLAKGLEQEDYYVKKFQKAGWKILNKAKTGKECGGLGGLNLRKWNVRTCREEALKYKTLHEFIDNAGAAYSVARKNKWLDEYTWLKPAHFRPGHWNYERCYAEAKKYTRRADFAMGCGSAYNRAKSKGWLNDYTWFTKRFRWTIEKCREEAERYSDLQSFRKGSLNAYTIARDRGWLVQFSWLQPKRVEQYKEDGEFVASYNSVLSASKATGLLAGNIKKCCKGIIKSAYGFRWRYATAEDSVRNRGGDSTSCATSI